VPDILHNSYQRRAGPLDVAQGRESLDAALDHELAEWPAEWRIERPEVRIQNVEQGMFNVEVFSSLQNSLFNIGHSIFSFKPSALCALPFPLEYLNP
jgi:hypothetical protein